MVLDLIVSTLRTLRAHKLRFALTSLGIVWGAFMLTYLTASMEGMQRHFHAEFMELGPNLVFFGGGLRTGHRNTNIPCLLTGGGFKGLTHGQHRAAPKEDTPLANLWTTMLQDAGAPNTRFADADGAASSMWS